MKYTCITCGHQTDAWTQSGDTVRCPECLHKNTLRKSVNAVSQQMERPQQEHDILVLTKDQFEAMRIEIENPPFIPGRF